MKQLPKFPSMAMPAAIVEHFTANQQHAKHALQQLPTNRELLNHIQQFGIQPI